LDFVQVRHDDEEKLDFKGGNVHIITSKEGWDQKIAGANRDKKIVSNVKRIGNSPFVL
jgi:thioredoxin 1